jgi:hypothetical protein
VLPGRYAYLADRDPHRGVSAAEVEGGYHPGIKRKRSKRKRKIKIRKRIKSKRKRKSRKEPEQERAHLAAPNGKQSFSYS